MMLVHVSEYKKWHLSTLLKGTQVADYEIYLTRYVYKYKEFGVTSTKYPNSDEENLQGWWSFGNDE